MTEWIVFRSLMRVEAAFTDIFQTTVNTQNRAVCPVFVTVVYRLYEQIFYLSSPPKHPNAERLAVKFLFAVSNSKFDKKSRND